MITLYCRTCQRPFPAFPSQITNENRQFCSRSCYRLRFGTILERFWSKVDRSGGPHACWPWIGRRDKDGYGMFTVNSRPIRAAKYIYEAENGLLLPGFIVCHRCDNPPCCNPGDLFPGTHSMNRRDGMQKGRIIIAIPNSAKRRGAGHPKTSFSDADIQEIRRLCLIMSQEAVAKRFGCGQSTVSRIHLRKVWAHVS